VAEGPVIQLESENRAVCRPYHRSFKSKVNSLGVLAGCANSVGPQVRDSAITSLRDEEVTGRAWLPNSFLSLWTRPKNRTTVEVRTQTSAPFCHDGPAWPCTGVLPRASAANHRKSISASRRDDLGRLQTIVVTSKQRIKPVRSFPAPGRAPAESGNNSF
jgi:hypothetical protein